MRRLATLFQEYRFLDSVRSLRGKTEIRFVESCKLLAIKVVGVQHNARVYTDKTIGTWFEACMVNNLVL